MDLQTIRTQTRTLIGDNGSTAKRFSDAQVNDAINRACYQYALVTKAVTALTTALTSDAAGLVSLSGLADMIEPIAVYYGETMLDWTTRGFENIRFGQNASAAHSGPPVRALMESAAKIQLLPTPATTHSVRVRYLAAPATLSADSDPVDSRISVPHQNALRYSAGAFLMMLGGNDEDLKRAQNFMGIFNSQIGVKGA